jgi:hypothetical protein
MGKGGSTEKHSSKHRDKDPDRKHKKRRKHDDDDGADRHRKHKYRKRDKDESKVKIVDDGDDEKLWVEKDIDMDGERVRDIIESFEFSTITWSLNQLVAANIPTAESLKLTSTADAQSSSATLPHAINTESVLKRDEWMLMPTSTPVMPADVQYQRKSHVRSPPPPPLTNDSFTEDYGKPSGDSRTTSGGVDFFSSLGTERKKNLKPEKPNPDKVCFFFSLFDLHYIV